MRIRKILVAFLTAAMMLPFCTLAANAAKSSAQGFDDDNIELCRVYDDVGIFDDETEDELNEIIRETSEKLEIYIAVYLSGTARSDYDTDVFSDEEYDRIFGKDTDGALYYMDLSGQYSPYDRISRAGKAILLYSADTIENSMLPIIFRDLPASGEEITPDQIERGIRTICSVMESYGSREPGALEYYHDTYTDKYIYYKNGETVITSSKPPALILMNLGISLFIGIIVAIICYFAGKSHYKFKPSCNPSVYVSRDESKFTRREDIFIRAHTTKVKIESSGGGGGHGGGGHGGGGGSHGGGGGGHR
ncbi:MAG: hypothetical protein ACI4JE_08210 [Ruminococcus sp.]|nr:hypothetical protein [Oscillospiraceae bacterium]